VIVISLFSLALVFLPMLVEAQRAARNERAQLARGGIEPAADVYKLMRIAYPAAFAAMLAEGLVRADVQRSIFDAGLAVFGAAKALKWWAILALGPSWTFRVIVVPGDPVSKRGPYRFLRHPNYMGVVMEFLGVAMMAGASVSGPLTIVLFGMLLKRRISVEERALASSARHPLCSL
jgi:methyltransferase